MSKPKSVVWRCDLLPQYQAYKRQIDAAVARVLRSGRYILAEEVGEFERDFAAYVGMAHGVGVANATDGLTMALRALGVGPGDEVVTTPFTAIPTVAAIVDAGATPVFADLDADTYLLDIDKAARAVGRKTKALMPVHIFGNMVDVPKLQAACGAIPVIEDASQAHGSTLRGRRAGSFGVLSVFSFYPTKNLGGYGDGGLVATSEAKLADALRRLRMYGMTDKDHFASDGINSRLDELQAAILRAKLPYLDRMNERRRAIADRYVKELDPKRFSHQKIPSGVRSNYHVFVTRFDGDRARLMARLDAAGIQTNIYYPLPLHLQEGLKRLGGKPGDFPVAEALCRRVVALPMYPELPDRTLDRIISAVNSA